MESRQFKGLVILRWMPLKLCKRHNDRGSSVWQVFQVNNKSRVPESFQDPLERMQT
jgi:hypothetical protein